MVFRKQGMIVEDQNGLRGHAELPSPDTSSASFLQEYDAEYAKVCAPPQAERRKSYRAARRAAAKPSSGSVRGPRRQ